jgi:hypothetical protein
LRAIDALLAGIVDYAGLFPPAGEDMRPALESFSSYLNSSDRDALGRFIVPFRRLKELEESGADLFPRGSDSEPWRLSVLVVDDVHAAGEEMLRFNHRHRAGSPDGHVIIDVAELKASTAAEIESQHAELPRSFTSYFEIPIKGDVSPLVKTLARAGSRAKVRTGGVTPEAFPPADAIFDFLASCRSEAVPFKATAGLHHPIRGSYRLTYEPGSPKGTMYGFLNLFVAAALVHAGEAEDIVLAALGEDDPSTFSFTDKMIAWRDKLFTVGQIREVRTALMISFGSCSFREPVDELESLARAVSSRNQ